MRGDLQKPSTQAAVLKLAFAGCDPLVVTEFLVATAGVHSQDTPL
jgi:hypothetical protein